MTEGSIAMGPVHRGAALAMSAALAAASPWVGWTPLIAMAVGLVALLAIKRPEVQRRWGASSVWAAWGSIELAVMAVVLLSDGPTEYMVVLLGIPTIMASPVLPIRLITPLACASAFLVIATGLAVDGPRLREYPPAYFYVAAVVMLVAVVACMARRSEDESSWRADRDPLTGQFNRRALVAHMASGAAPGHVLMIDIDLFKAVNDEAGHALGDRVLAEVGSRIAAVVGTRGSVYRLGGEEFAVLVPAANTGVEGRRLGEEIRREIGGAPLAGRRITVSVGVASSDGSFREMLARADEAVYRAKAQGRNRVAAAEPPVAGPQRRRGDAINRPAMALAGAPAPPPDRSAGDSVRRLVARDHLITMTERQRREALLPYAVIFAAQLAAVPWSGWTLVAGTAFGAVVHRLAQRRIRLWTHPQAVMMATWMVWQTSAWVGAVFVPAPRMRILPGFAILLVTVSSSFARPYALAATAYACALIVALPAVTDPGSMWDTPQEFTCSLAVVAAVVMVGRALGARALGLDRDSSFDALTGLPNWKACQASVQEWEATRGKDADRLPLLLIDLDNLKAINDAHGHARGDEVIRGVAARLEEVTRHEGALFRLGGEEFAVLVRGDDVDDVEALGERLRRTVSDRLVAGLDVTVSIGAAVAHHGLDPGTLFNAADGALYGAKHGGRNRVERAGGPGGGAGG